ncbi:MAG: 50S ribosomal protein L32 [Deltaproteobacteria bacterium]|nr:50S ribosomal protein L32 [Deltaproteobacteria bacterium]
MAVPKRRTSKAKKRQRRSHLALTPPQAGICPNCQAPTVPHRVCPSCGTYKGETFIDVD